MLRTLAGMTAATLYIGDMLLEAGKDILIVTKPEQKLCHYSLDDINKYYAVKNIRPQHIKTCKYSSVYSAMEENFSSDFLDLLRSADRILSFSEGLALLPDTVNLHGVPFSQYYHFPSPAAAPSIRTSLYCNSQYTAFYVQLYYGRTSVVWNPLPDPAFYNNTKPFEDRDIDALYVGRIANDKNIKALKDIASNHKVVIAGSSWWKDHTPILDDVDAELKVDIDIKSLCDLYSRSKLYVSTKGMGATEPDKREHFGIGVIEAAFSGAVPIVHRSGGPFTDFLNYRNLMHGVCYTNSLSLAKSVDQFLTKPEWNEISKKAYDRAIALRKRAAAGVIEHA